MKEGSISLPAEELCRQWGIGLTGGIATGKSFVASLLRARGYLVIDADQLAREATMKGSPATTAIRQAFGEQLFDKSGELNRRALGTLVFSDHLQRVKLEAILHPTIKAVLAKTLAKSQVSKRPQIWFYEASLLIEKNRCSDFHEIWLTSCSEQTQVRRLMARDHLSEGDAQSRIKTQMPDQEKRRHATRIIDTEGSPEEVTEKVAGLLSIIA